MCRELLGRMLSLIKQTENDRDHYLLLRVTILEQIYEFFSVFHTGSSRVVDLNFDKTCSGQPDSAVHLA